MAELGPLDIEGISIAYDEFSGSRKFEAPVGQLRQQSQITMESLPYSSHLQRGIP